LFLSLFSLLSSTIGNCLGSRHIIERAQPMAREIGLSSRDRPERTWDYSAQRSRPRLNGRALAWFVSQRLLHVPAVCAPRT
jgi:hypothetical protein